MSNHKKLLVVQKWGYVWLCFDRLFIFYWFFETTVEFWELFLYRQGDLCGSSRKINFRRDFTLGSADSERFHKVKVMFRPTFLSCLNQIHFVMTYLNGFFKIGLSKCRAVKNYIYGSKVRLCFDRLWSNGGVLGALPEGLVL